MHSIPRAAAQRRSGRLAASASAVLALFATICAPAHACSSCGCTLNADWASQGVTNRSGWSGDLRYDYYDQDDLRSGTHRVDRSTITFPNEEEIQQRTVNRDTTLTLDYGFGNDWGITFRLPWLDRYHTTIAEGDTEVSTSRFSEIGDMRVLARYLGFSEAQDWGLQFGLKLPTGRTNIAFGEGPEAGEPLDRGLQPGTGSTDLLLGAFRFGGFGDAGVLRELDWFSQAMVQVPVAADHGFRPGAALNVSAGLHYRGFGAIVPQAQLNARFEGRESGDEADTANSGATLLYFSPGATWAATQRLSFYAFAQVPVYQRVNGLQIEPKWSVSAGVTAAF
jgi:hypothetical protein